MTFVAPSSRHATVVHVVRYRFGPNSHPAIWRSILGLGRHFQNVVVSGTRPGYFPQSDVDGVRLANDAGIEVVAEQDIDGLQRPEVAAAVSALVRRRYGRIDAVVGHLLGSPRALYLAQHLSAPILSLFHGDDANVHLSGETFGRAYERLRAAPAACFLGVSQNVVRRLVAFGMPPERTFLHHLGVDLPRYPSAPQHSRPLKLVMTGLFRRQKGHEIAIRGFAEFVRRFPDASLHFIGGAVRPEQRRLGEELEALVARMELGDAIRFRGPMAVDGVARELAGADIALQTSVFVPEDGQVEGIPNAILEAMATGLPVVATRHGGIPEAVVHERTGLLVDEYDTEGLARALSRLGTDPGLRRRYGLEGRRVVEERFNAARQGDLLADRIRRMIDAYARLGPSERADWRPSPATCSTGRTDFCPDP
jgi:colanic acid/amylovoran biosynthesis glycosyltransferase